MNVAYMLTVSLHFPTKQMVISVKVLKYQGHVLYLMNAFYPPFKESTFLDAHAFTSLAKNVRISTYLLLVLLFCTLRSP